MSGIWIPASVLEWYLISARKKHTFFQNFSIFCKNHQWCMWEKKEFFSNTPPDIQNILEYDFFEYAKRLPSSKRVGVLHLTFWKKWVFRWEKLKILFPKSLDFGRPGLEKNFSHCVEKKQNSWVWGLSAPIFYYMVVCIFSPWGSLPRFRWV